MISTGWLLAVGRLYSISVTPLVVNLPISPLPYSANQILPSGPPVIPIGWLVALPSARSAIVPGVAGAKCATLPTADSVNQRFPSDPAAIPSGLLAAVGMAYSVTAPSWVIRPILLVPDSVNHRLPSAPRAIP